MNAHTHDIPGTLPQGFAAVSCDMGGIEVRERERKTLGFALRRSEDGWQTLLPPLSNVANWSEPDPTIGGAIERAARASNPQWKIARRLNFLVVLTPCHASGLNAYDEARRTPQGWQWRKAGSRDWGATSATLESGVVSASNLAMAA